MPILSITRLRLVETKQVFRFLKISQASIEQALRSDGLIAGQIGVEPLKSFWTVTLWEDQKSMLRFVGSGPHLEAMPKLAHLCCEAVVCHTEVESRSIPAMTQIADILGSHAKFAHVLRPSAWQSENRLRPLGWVLVRTFK